MNRGFAWFPSAFRLSAVLGVGKARTCWQRDVVRKTEGLIAVRRGGAWVEEFGAIHPKLWELPLLGTTLSVLTGQASQAQETQPKTTRPGKARLVPCENPLESNRNKTTANALTDSPFQPEVSNRQSAAKRKVVEETPADHPAETLSQLQTQAERSLLSRLAGGGLAFESTEPQQARSSSAKGKHNVAFGGAALGEARSFAETGKRSEALFPPVCRDSAAQRDWLNHLAQKAGRAITRKQPNTTETAKPTQGDAQRPGQSPSLQEQWATPLDGTCASLELLYRFVQKDSSRYEGSSGAAPRRVSRSQPLSFLEKPHSHHPVEKVDEYSQRLDKWDGLRGKSVSESNELGPKPTPPVTAQTGSTFSAPEFGVNGQEGHSAGESKSSAPIIPPNVTPSLPDLLPPQRVGSPPLPVAAATARRGAREEGTKATDDLDALAAKIKQILDEQARRHGIDV
jgi:hypothetical protein